MKFAWQSFQEDKNGLMDFISNTDNSHALDTNDHLNEESNRRKVEQPKFDVSFLLPESFRASMMEAFKTYSELLRHFYSILGRRGDQKATVGSKSEEKVKKILERLNIVGKKLEKMKNEIGTELSSDGQPFNRDAVYAQGRCIGDILQLRNHANNVWERFKKTR